MFLADMDLVLLVKEVKGEEKSNSVKGTDSYKPFLLDSGCSYHMCSNLAWFMKLEDFHGPTVSTAGHVKHKVTKRGTICFSSSIDGTTRSFALTDVQYIL